jgi:Bacterial protein of unknown function (Gcw_chp)
MGVMSTAVGGWGVMRTAVAAGFLAFALSTASAFAADLVVKAPPAAPAAAPATPEWDVAFGGAGMTDYIFRGITQSDHKPSVTAYSELRFNPKALSNFQLYVGSSGESIDFPNRAASEIDFYGGVRPTIDKLALDFGFWYYYYPGGINFPGTGSTVIIFPNVDTCTNGFFVVTNPRFPGVPFCNVDKRDLSYYEGYGKATLTINDNVAIGGTVYYSPSWLNSGAYGLYASGNAKLTAPSSWFPKDWGAYASGELAHYWFGTTDKFYATPDFPNGIPYPDYTTWNIGVGVTWKVFTLDLRWYDTDLSKVNCNVLTADHTAHLGGLGAFTPTNPDGLVSNWCGSTFVAKLSFDLTVNSNLK